jgi:PncC family amidohydrolase
LAESIATETGLTSAAPPPADVHDLPPEARLNALLADGRLSIAAAESCTGGNVARRITDIPGSSAYFLGSIVSYANEAKATLLGVSPDILQNPGAVSDPTACAMAEGARRAFGADVAVSTTGIAGPAGGTARKPVGTVFIAASGPAGTVVEEHHFPGGRADVIAAATESALTLLAATVEAAIEASAVRRQESGTEDSPSQDPTGLPTADGDPRGLAADA